MDSFLKFLVVWLGFDVVVLASAWYLTRAIKPKFPQWWRQVIAQDMPQVKIISFHKTERGWQPREV